jgi:hypothetical protein
VAEGVKVMPVELSFFKYETGFKIIFNHDLAITSFQSNKTIIKPHQSLSVMQDRKFSGISFTYKRRDDENNNDDVFKALDFVLS